LRCVLNRDSIEASIFLRVRTILPAGHGFECLKEQKAKTEIHQQAQVDLQRYVPDAKRKMWHQQKINRIPREHSDEGVNEIGYGWFKQAIL